MTSIFESRDPATGEIVWTGAAASAEECAAAISTARAAFADWSATTIEERVALVRRYRDALQADADAIATAISRETGKPLWETRTEVASMIGKVDLSIAAHAERTGGREQAAPFGRAVLRHRPHGVMAVLGPYNFPGHLPNGHIVPALLAGNTVVFKPSEETPLTGELIGAAMRKAGVPEGVFAVVQGGRDTGAALIAEDIDGLLFTGSAGAGAYFTRAFADRPKVILALELGGNNPLIAWDGAPEAIASIVIASAFITSGQRCSCARRLIVPEGAAGDAIVDAVAALSDRLTVGAWNDSPEPFMGPLISPAAAARVSLQAEGLMKLGAIAIRPFEARPGLTTAFVGPAILDVTGIDAPDDEIFGPLLQVRRVADFEAAIAAANDTRFGLSAGLISDDDALWGQFQRRIRAGVVNRNRPTTGAAGSMPFGGLGASGNHRPSAWYAADYCAYPVASFEADRVVDQIGELRGLTG
ncbi:MAG: succinylglutamate-semialdehyde dehydrogenase [Sphingomonas bacterium]|uniref:succinylglutamate-semialdehyde dehydrogenase n=1 Tax=Sphingomonas bacterium TaxID=1895847 RepID=UPI00262C0FAA|nr:succinylglutamate-semialdehyde dehydrogenase [Sphingomonas bacterium]MDB5707330.1 succinylglutamate-semialdehyde dehydrogenase [Sphingomonas bacterium]